LLCKTFKNLSQRSPSPVMRHVVVFHPEEKKPRFKWVPLTQKRIGLDAKKEGVGKGKGLSIQDINIG
jgi:hypothetical protein